MGTSTFVSRKYAVSTTAPRESACVAVASGTDTVPPPGTRARATAAAAPAPSTMATQDGGHTTAEGEGDRHGRDPGHSGS